MILEDDALVKRIHQILSQKTHWVLACTSDQGALQIGKLLVLLSLTPATDSDVVMGTMQFLICQSNKMDVLRMAAINKKVLPRDVFNDMLLLIGYKIEPTSEQDLVLLSRNDVDQHFMTQCLESLSTGAIRRGGNPSDN